MSDDKSVPKISEKELQAVMDKIEYCRIRLLVNFPFFGILLLKMPVVEDYTIEVAATDYKRIYYNPLCFNKLDKKYIAWILVHEVLHVALNHRKRAHERQHIVWNYACDYAIHDTMKDYVDFVATLPKNSVSKIGQMIDMPDFCLYDVKYKDMAAEEIYVLLNKEVQQQLPKISLKVNSMKSKSKNTGDGDGDDGDEFDNELKKAMSGGGKKLLDSHDKWDEGKGSGSDKDIDDLAWKVFLQSALEQAKGKHAGKLPLGLERILNGLVKPKLDWRTLLSEFIEYEVNDYSFNPPDRRYQGDFMIPDYNDVTEIAKDIVFWIDTSGSISNGMLDAFYSEIAGTLACFPKLNGWLGFFDHSAYDLQEFDDISSLSKIRPKGGGGTNFHAPFEHIRDKFDIEHITGIVMLTDGYCDFPPENIANNVPVLWIITTKDIVAPWGLSVYMNMDVD